MFICKRRFYTIVRFSLRAYVCFTIITLCKKRFES